jgi:L-amino acid N-acyltransferase YncA
MNIRLTQSDDVPSITALLNLEIEHNTAHFGIEPELESTIQAQLESAQDRFPWYTALDGNGSFLGFSKSGPWSPRGGYNWTAEITIYLTADARGKGIGKELYSHLLDTLRAQRFQIIVAGVAEPNPASVKLHTSIGMERTGYNKTMGYKHGRWIDVGYYQMVLGDLSNPPPPVLSVSDALKTLE